MTYLGIDFGTKRLGLAVSDEHGALALPLQAITKTTNDDLLSRIEQVVHERKIQAVVVGLPLSLRGERTLTSRQAENFARKIEGRLSLPVYLTDEACTSAEAEEKLKEAGISGKRRKEYLDSQAAVEILEGFLRQTAADR